MKAPGPIYTLNVTEDGWPVLENAHGASVAPGEEAELEVELDVAGQRVTVPLYPRATEVVGEAIVELSSDRSDRLADPVGLEVALAFLTGRRISPEVLEQLRRRKAS